MLVPWVIVFRVLVEALSSVVEVRSWGAGERVAIGGRLMTGRDPGATPGCTDPLQPALRTAVVACSADGDKGRARIDPLTDAPSSCSATTRPCPRFRNAPPEAWRTSSSLSNFAGT